MRRSLEEEWGNPSSLHRMGMDAEAGVTETRALAARLLHCEPEELFFTGSGTEANNTALFGAARRGRKRGGRIVTTAVEHPSVLHCAEQLRDQGFEVVFLTPGADGCVDARQVYESITPDTVLVSMMLVNNELGSIQPVEEAARAIRQAGAPALLHCDAVQAFGKLPVDVRRLGVDLLSASGHKLHGPKGIGLLYIRRGLQLPPLLFGGGQERGMRSGTEPVPLIRGLCGALEELPEPARQLEKMRELRQYAADTLAATGFVQINSPATALPYILNFSVPGYRSETLLHFLDSKNIFVSSGSACAKGAGSYVLRACGLSPARVDSALRVSFSRFSTKQEIDLLAAALAQAVQKIRKVKL